jgi:heat shock protein HslJ
MIFLHKQLVLAILLAGLLLAACAPAGSGQAELDGTQWQLTTINGEKVAEMLAGRAVTIRFEGAEAGGSAGCNTYGGSYEADAASGSISFSDLFATLMACEDEAVMQLEASFLEALNNASNYEIEGDTLRFFAGEQTLVFSRSEFNQQ